jgi:2'-5' RNA ligase
MSHFVLELFFDADTDRKVRAIWELMDELPDWSPPARGESKPHISVASMSELDVKGFDSAVQVVAISKRPFEIFFTSLGAFPSNSGVVFLAPIVTSELLGLHNTLENELERFGASVSLLYRLGNWVPHCTLAMPLMAAVPKAVYLALGQDLHIRGHIESMGLVHVSSAGSTLGAIHALVRDTDNGQ